MKQDVRMLTSHLLNRSVRRTLSPMGRRDQGLARGRPPGDAHGARNLMCACPRWTHYPCATGPASLAPKSGRIERTPVAGRAPFSPFCGKANITTAESAQANGSHLWSRLYGFCFPDVYDCRAREARDEKHTRRRAGTGEALFGNAGCEARRSAGQCVRRTRNRDGRRVGQDDAVAAAAALRFRPAAEPRTARRVAQLGLDARERSPGAGGTRPVV